MEHLSEILKILDGALRANSSMATNYAGLLADKLEEAGERNQARLIRERLARAPMALASAQDASGGTNLNEAPVDGESRLNTVDISLPNPADIALLLPSGIQNRVTEFLDSVRHYDALARAGAALPNRLLVYGPPGTGKTQMARWITANLSLPLLTVRCDTLVSSLLGQTSRNLRRVFDYAQQKPSVLFLDEFDALAGARGNERDIGELQRVVIALLQNIDALPESTILVASTNHEQLLDPAVWRRFSFRIAMPMPDQDMRRNLWMQMLGDFAPNNFDWNAIAAASDGISGALIEQICLDAKRTAILKSQKQIDALELFRRLGLALALSKGFRLSTEENEMHWLREWDQKRFSLRNLATIYKATVHKVTNVTKEKVVDGKAKKGKKPSKK